MAVLALALCAALATAGLAGESPSLVQHGEKLTGAEEIGAGRFGHGVALSADGATALVGGPGDGEESGAVWPFARSGEALIGQGGKLVGSGEVGGGRLGDGVALSADGDTALAGAPNDRGGVGAVWVYERSGASWTVQAKLTGEGEAGSAWFGRSVALSADGNTALVGGFVDHSDVGAAWVFARSGSTWTQQGPELTGGEESGAGGFGWSVALAGDGETALVGGQRDGEGAGAAWVLTRSGSTWTPQGPKLVGGGEQGAALFGHRVALSASGNSALIGGPRDDQNRGAAWAFARLGSTWSQQGAKLTAEDERGKGELGWSVALSADGTIALIGGLGDSQRAGAAWVFGEPSPTPATVPVTIPSGTPTSSSGGDPQTTVPAPQHGVAGFRAASSGVLLLGKRLLVHGGRARARLRCLAATTCRGRLALAIGMRGKAARRQYLATVASAGFSIRHGRTVTVSLKLGAPARRRLRTHRRLAGSLAVRLLAPQTRMRSYAVELVLRRPVGATRNA
ncbi:MAG TPA: hypothetical protein VGI76_04555 [Solirubrobacteraceae bacterium]